MKRIYWILLIVLLAGLLSLPACGPVQRHYEAGLILGDIRAGEEDSRLKRTRPAPERETVNYTGVTGEARVADLYTPGGEIKADLVLVHGFTEDGRRDPRLIQFAETLARAGFRILAPEVETLTRMDVSPENVQDVVDASRWLDEHGDGDGVGVAALSFSVATAVLAAMEPEGQPHIGWVVGVGGYYDLVDSLTYVTTGYYTEDGREVFLEPRVEGRWVVLLTQLDRVPDDDDRELLERIAYRHLDDPGTDTEDKAEDLTPSGRAVYDLLTNRDPERVPELLADLPEPVRDEIEALNLARRDLSDLQAYLLLVHGRDDDVIPWTQSQALLEAAPASGAELRLVTGLTHVDVDPGLLDAWRLLRAVNRLLVLRDDPPAPGERDDL
ncbi:pimeloyl-ACP methyl ester carboxylesterase [Alkalispirillum mobile]|uniref:Pimeloyl-ACP methyl ester carboxylesterase n=1 Tax=Alkalispirillum mobile TaxID=85925 RepID=A0A498BVX5_9GAMM|nr:alpha/beta hydrolase [Alkalispirillum mobile]RLK46526.1 pimeloyl-ACP methyl ester carboxylesterase [Alkalispirillum mobile]